MRSFASRLFLCLVSVGIGPAAPGLLLKNVRIIDVRKESTSALTNVLIQGNRIESIAARAFVPDALAIDGGGKFLIPGLWDMHVHAGEIEQDWFPLYLANGVTGLREMAASGANSLKQKQYHAEVESGAKVGPRLVWTIGPIDRKAAGNEAQARAAVRTVKASGASFVKVYNGLSREAYFAIVSEAFRQLMPVTGHVPDAVRWSEAVAAGQRSIEHLDGMLLNCALRESESRQMLMRNQSPVDLILNSFDRSRLVELAKRASTAACWHTPTLTMLRFYAYPNASVNDERLRYVRSDYRQDWLRQSRREKETPQSRALYLKQKEAVRALYTGGAPILAGTDTPNPFCIPGFALHEELALLVESGLSPAAALRAATWEPARYFGQESLMGTVEPGKFADLVLLNASPLADIRNTTRISGVVRNGRWFDRAALSGMLRNVETSARKSAIH